MSGGWLGHIDVIAELRKGARCDPRVRAWTEAVPPAACCISVVSLPKGRRSGVPRGAGKLAATRRQAWFGPRLLAADAPVLRGWIGRMGQARVTRRALEQARCAHRRYRRQHGSAIAARNMADFLQAEVALLHPWQA